ncbi:MAG: pyridoxal phosphate-dependent aminotransferase [Phycisphaerales bacterium]
MDIQRLLAPRMCRIDASGIRRVSDLAKSMPGAINLSIGQPEFPVPETVKSAAIEAIRSDRNAYTANPGLDVLRTAIARRLRLDIGWTAQAPEVSTARADPGLMITSGTAGALLLACMAVLGPGDEFIIPDPYFVMYPYLAEMCEARAVRCDTYPDFRMTAERVERVMSPRTKAVLFNSPGNPTGVVGSMDDCRELLELCRRKNVLLISDEIYDEFTFSESRTDRFADGSRPACPSPARLPGASDDVLLIRGFGKTYACTGWRLGYAAGPAALIEQMVKLQQYTFVCAPTPLQWGVLAALDVDMGPQVATYERRRDRVVAALSSVTEVASPGGAFYAFPRVPERLRMTGQQFAERAIAEKVLVIPGGVFSGDPKSPRDSHLRLSFAVADEQLERGLEVLVGLMKKG